MPLIITSTKNHNGFELSQPLNHNGNLLVLTGKNGCGKTRFIQSIKNLSSRTIVDSTELIGEDVILIHQSQLTPNFEGSHDDTKFQTKITSTLQLFDREKMDFDSPFDLQKSKNHATKLARTNSNIAPDIKPLPYDSLYRLCSTLSLKLNKKPSTLTHDEITLYFEDHIQSVFGIQNISSICNRYMKRRTLNRYNRYLALVENENISYVTDEQFVDQFGEKPWITINKILDQIFDGKFYFNSPDETSRSYSYQARLIQRDSGQAVSAGALSSGENTLLWLALTLFNSQYYKSETIKPSKLLLIDEPDAYLHPQMVIKMYRVLQAFSNSFDSRIIITTHSPTTVALAPENSIYVVCENIVSNVSKDEAVAELLDGVTQISISPENRRQVFVESLYDANTFQLIFSNLVHHSNSLDSKISLNFVSSGPKMPKQQIKDKLRQILDINNNELADEFVEAINGVGNCSQVIGQVEALAQNGHETVRGIIDRDKNNTSKGNIAVLGENYAYSIENIALDPICLLLLLHTNKQDHFQMSDLCGENIFWGNWIKSQELMQEALDRFIHKVLNKENNKNSKITYTSGLTLQTDSEYLNMNGHSLEKLIIERYPALKAFTKTGKEGELKYEVVKRSMINLTNGHFIPKEFELVLSQVQN